MRKIFLYLNTLPWAKPLTMLVIVNDVILLWALFAATVLGIKLDPVYRDIILGITGFVVSGNFTKSYLEHKLTIKEHRSEDYDKPESD